MIKKINLCLFGCLLANTISAQNNFIQDSLDTYIQREMKRWNLPGMAIAIVQDGKVVTVKGYGYADADKKTPVTENTVFQIASNTKAFTGTSLALLEHYGKLKLNDKVKNYLSWFKMNEDWRTEQLSIADVLSHRIGYETFQTDMLNWGSTCTRKQLIENMANVKPKFGLRETYGYCNMGFLVAGEIIPAVCDTSWDDYLKHHYFIPLGMKSTNTTYASFYNAPNTSKPYTLVHDKITELIPANTDNLGPAAAITSSVNDLSKWLLMQLANGKYNGKQIVPQEVIERTRESFFIEEPSGTTGNNFNNYGLGWFLKDNQGIKIITHDGGANGFLSKTVLIPEKNIGFVILTNSDAQYFYDALGTQLINAVLDKPYINVSKNHYTYFLNNHAKETAKEVELTLMVQKYKPAKDAYTKMAGVYSNKVYGKISVEAKAGYAEVSFEHHPQYKGKINLASDRNFVITYNDPTLGIHELQYSADVLEIKVNDFIDMDVYPFTKISNTFTPFAK